MSYDFTRSGAQIEAIHNTVDDPKSNAQFSDDIRTIAGEYRGLWPDTGGSANKGDTYQTQVSGIGTGQFFTALQGTTTDPAGGSANWMAAIGVDGLSKYTDIVYTSIANMIDGNPISAKDGDTCWANGSMFQRNSNNNGDLSDFDVKPLILGNQEGTSNSDRDLYQVNRVISGLTDCHAFADKTVIDDATDSGTYGTFDSTTEIAGTHSQSHQFSFQNRAKFSGEGSIATWGGYISWPTLTGAVSTVGELFHFEAKDLDSLGRFDAVTNQFGIKVLNQTKGMSGNYAFWTNQDVGYSFYSNGSGKMLQAGEAAFSSPVIFGASVPVSGVPISWTGGVGDQKGFVSSSSDSVQYGVVGDYKHVFVSNAAERLILEDSSENYALRPASGTQNLGIDSRPFNEVKAKQFNMTPITDAEASNLSFFVDSADGKAKFKDALGVVNDLY